MLKNHEWIVIGIGGVTCGGKTTLANKLLGALGPVYIFNQDKYFYPDDSPHHIKCPNLDHNNYDILSSLDMEGMYGDVLKTMEGENRAHAYCLDQKDRFTIPGKKFLIVEGFTVLNYKPILELCQLSYFLFLEYSECVSRRSFRLYDPPDIDGYFDQCVWPEHLNYRAQIEKEKRVMMLDGTKPDAFDIVMAHLKAMVHNK